MYPEILLRSINEQRLLRNYLTIEQTMELTRTGNIITDPFSLLISGNVFIGENNIFFPNVIIEANSIHAPIKIGNNNLIYPQTFLLADCGGRLTIGNFNHFEGGVAVKANMANSCITIGDNGRYLNGVQIVGICKLGSGSQVIGNITVQNCVLEEGESYRHNDPDSRAGLLKGYGLARNLMVGKGKVIEGNGKFEAGSLQSQSVFHPKPEKEE